MIDIDKRIGEVIQEVFDDIEMGHLDSDAKRAIKALLTDVLNEVKPERLTPKLRGELQARTGAVDDNVNLGYEDAVDQMEAKQRELGL